MSTGYTNCIKDGISFEDFVMRCARAMGACVTMRDDPYDKPIPEEFKPSSYHTDEIKKFKKELVALKKMNQNEFSQKAKDKFDSEIKHKENAIKSNNKLRGKYNAMLIKVKAWNPPTSEHQGLKDFMIQQIENSIEVDCSNSYYESMNIKLLSADEYFEEEHHLIMQELSYHSKEHEEELSCVASRNNWIKELRKSIAK